MVLKSDDELPLHHGEVSLNCIDCDRKLVKIIKISGDTESQKVYYARCPCGSTSFKKRLFCKIKIASAGPDVLIDSIDTKDDTTVFNVKVNHG